MNHLGDRTSAYVDGRLTGSQLARAEAHLGVCAACARQVEAERSLAAQLRGLGDAAAPGDLSARILTSAPGCGGAPWERLGRRAADRASLPAWRRRVAARTAAGGGFVVAVAAGIVLLGSAAPAVTAPAVLRAAEFDGAALRTTVQVAAARDSTEVAAQALRAEGWALPDLPADLHISGVTIHREGEVEVLRVEIVGTSGTALLLEVQGSVDGDAPPEAELVRCGPVTAVVTGDPEVRSRVAGLLPAGDVDSSLTGRFDRGVHAIVSFFSEVAP